MDFLQMLQQAAGEAAEGILGKDTKIDDGKYVNALQHIYVKSLTRIFKIIDKISAGPLTDIDSIKRCVDDVLPDENQPRKYFAIGDRVIIGCSYEHFKYIQKKVPAWKKNMRNLFSEPGVVTGLNSTKDATVQVYFPKIFSSCAISTAVLEIDPNPEQLVSRSQWRVGDFVQTHSHKLVVKTLMLRLPDIPNKFVGEPGKVIAVTTAGVFVTYDGLRSYAIDSSLLRKAKHEPRFEIEEKVHPRGIRPGDKVRVLSQLRILIENQKGKGGWNTKMCVLAGKIGYVTDINGDGTIDVACGFGKGWRMNDQSLLKMGELETREEGQELKFNPGDKVKVRVTEDIRMHLIAKNIPLVFLEYLLVTGEVQSIDDDYDAWTTFNSTSKTCMETSSLVKASQSDADAFEDIRERLRSMKVGDTVYLDVGPPNYVRTILSQHEVDPEIVTLLTSVGIVTGWSDSQHAAVKLSNEKVYRINKKYLTTPDKFDVSEAKEEDFGLTTVQEMQSAIEDCVATLHRQENSELLRKSFGVELYSMLQGKLPTVEFRIRSSLAQSKPICDLLQQKYAWELQEICPDSDTYTAKGFNTSTQKVKLVLLYNDDLYLSSHASGDPTSWTEGVPQSSCQSSPSISKDGRRKEDKCLPDLTSVKDFKLLKLHDETLSRTVYFPYIVHGPSRATADPKGYDSERKRKSSIEFHNVKEVNIHSQKVANIIM